MQRRMWSNVVGCRCGRECQMLSNARCCGNANCATPDPQANEAKGQGPLCRGICDGNPTVGQGFGMPCQLFRMLIKEIFAKR